MNAERPTGGRAEATVEGEKEIAVAQGRRVPAGELS